MASPKFFDKTTYSPTHSASIAPLGAAGASYNQATEQALVDAVNAIIVALKSAGIVSNP